MLTPKQIDVIQRVWDRMQEIDTMFLNENMMSVRGLMQEVKGRFPETRDFPVVVTLPNDQVLLLQTDPESSVLSCELVTPYSMMPVESADKADQKTILQQLNEMCPQLAHDLKDDNRSRYPQQKEQE